MEDEVHAFMGGFCRNDSIKELQVYHNDIEFGRLSPFIINNGNLKELRLFDIHIGLENAHSLAMALHQRKQKSLNAFCLNESNIDNEAFREITAALRGYPCLKEFGVSKTLINREGCVSLGEIIMTAALYIKEIFFVDNDFDDGDLHILVNSLVDASSLRLLKLSSNRSVTATGFRALSRLLCSSSPLETLFLEKMNIYDQYPLH